MTKYSSQVYEISNFLKLVVSVLLVSVILIVPGISVFDFIQNKVSYELCKRTENSIEKTNCFKNLVKSSVKKGNINYSISLMKETLRNDSGDCHTLAHLLGRDFYSSLKNGSLIRINDPMTICGYGFWHGFMGEVVAENNYEDLSFVCKKMLGENKSLYSECYHGFGLGFVGDPPKQEMWGKTSDTVYQGLKKCEDLTKGGDYSNDCFTGVFHQILSYIKTSEYKYVLTKEELFSFCMSFEDPYKNSCLLQFAPALSAFTGYSFPKLFDLFDANYSKVEASIRDQMMYTMVAGRVNESSDDETKSYLVYCFERAGVYKTSCIQGLFGGIVLKSKSGEVDAVKKIINMCKSTFSNEEDVNVCLENASFTAKNHKSLNKDLINFCKEQTLISC